MSKEVSDSGRRGPDPEREREREREREPRMRVRVRVRVGHFWRFVFSKLIADKEIRPTGKQNFHMRTHIHMHIINIHRHTDTCT